jgi:hypothetical protein
MDDEVDREFTVEERGEPNLGINGLMGNSTGVTSARKRYVSDCICIPHRESFHRHTRLGSLSITTKASLGRKHLPECRYAKYEVAHKSKSLRVSYDGLRRILSRAVDISMSLTTGAGGFSISPNITVRPMVDETQSPVFQIMRFMNDIVHASHVKRLDERTTMQIVELGVHRVLQQYKSSRHSPYEVNHKGQSVLHLWVDVSSMLIL